MEFVEQTTFGQLLNYMEFFCRYSKDSYTFLVKYLATFAGADASTLSEAKEEAVRAIIEFIKSPDMFQVELDCWKFETSASLFYLLIFFLGMLFHHVLVFYAILCLGHLLNCLYNCRNIGLVIRAFIL